MRFTADYSDTSSSDGEYPASSGQAPSAPRLPAGDPLTRATSPTAAQWDRLIELHRTLRRTMKDIENTLLELRHSHSGQPVESCLGLGQVDTPVGIRKPTRDAGNECPDITVGYRPEQDWCGDCLCGKLEFRKRGQKVMSTPENFEEERKAKEWWKIWLACFGRKTWRSTSSKSMV
ncbi:hypothetical protein NM208_g4904 [Fusarium decemcellulare]|uniref:Uncharacterized protein n=1 Tax=Fusarium decemcellulare TaxID=57161 RepID=A0ACC1SIX5_9HYPO|nr:hypothetical protein NM208_g4904 [Fusarium decemcellulare]